MKRGFLILKQTTFVIKRNTLRDVFDRHRFESVQKLNDLYRSYGCNDVCIMSTVSRKVFFRFMRDLFKDIILNGDVFIFPGCKRRATVASNIHIGYGSHYNNRWRGKFTLEHGYHVIQPKFQFTGRLRSIHKWDHYIFFSGWLKSAFFSQVKSNFRYGIHQL